jgi:hypothetical protein
MDTKLMKISEQGKEKKRATGQQHMPGGIPERGCHARAGFFDA